MPYIKKQPKKATNDNLIQAAVKRYPILKYFLPRVIVNPGPKFENVCRDPDGSLNKDFVLMQSGSLEKGRWMKLWMECTTKADKWTMTCDQFLLYFNLTDCIWMRRLFDIVNYGLTGSLMFCEFFRFLTQYVVIDKMATIELCFRLISRRGMTFNPEYSCLDAEDIKHFLIERYYGRGKLKFNLPKIKRQASNITTTITETADLKDGTILFKDFEWFANHNTTMIKFTHHIQQHFRKCLFGMGFWVNKSRSMAYTRRGGFLSLTVPSRCNLECKAFCAKGLNDPVLDKNGYPVKPPKKKAPPRGARFVAAAAGAEAGGHQTALSSPSPTRPGTREAGGPQTALSSPSPTRPGTREAPSRPMTSGSAPAGGLDAGSSVVSKGVLAAGSSAVDSNAGSMYSTATAFDLEAQKKKKMLRYKEHLDVRKIPTPGTMETDFPEAERLRKEKRRARLLRKAGKTVEEMVADVSQEEVVEEEEEESDDESIAGDEYERIVREDNQQRDERDEHAHDTYVAAYLRESHDPKNFMPVDRTRHLVQNVEAVVEYL